MVGQANDRGGVEEQDKRRKQDVQYLFWKIWRKLPQLGFLGKQKASQ